MKSLFLLMSPKPQRPFYNSGIGSTSTPRAAASCVRLADEYELLQKRFGLFPCAFRQRSRKAVQEKPDARMTVGLASRNLFQSFLPRSKQPFERTIKKAHHTARQAIRLALRWQIWCLNFMRTVSLLKNLATAAVDDALRLMREKQCRRSDSTISGPPAGPVTSATHTG
jgi:hypothetical protein